MKHVMEKFTGFFLQEQGFFLKVADFTSPITAQLRTKKVLLQIAVHQVQAVPHLLQQNQPDVWKVVPHVY